VNLYRHLVTNHPLANIAFAVILLLGLVSYLSMPREQDPEINFNWVNVNTALPGASSADVEKRVTTPLEDAIRSVQDIRFVSSTSREGVSNILVRFRDMDERSFDKRINDLRREIQNRASAELPADAEDPVILEITTSNGFPTAIVALTGRADDETLRSTAFAVRKDIERLDGVDRVLALGLDEPELQVDFNPAALAARGLQATDLADAVGGWYRDVFAGRIELSSGEWLVRAPGQSPDPAYLAGLNLVPRSAPAQQTPIEQVAEVGWGRARASEKVLFEGEPAILLSITKKSKVNTLQLVERIGAYLEQRNTVLASSGLQLVLADDQTIPTRDAIAVMQSNAIIGLLLVFAVCWLFLGTGIAALVASGVVFSIAGTFLVLDATGNTLNTSVLLGVVIVLGMLVDDAVVVVEDIYYRIERGSAPIEAALAAMGSVAAPVLASVATTMSAFLPLMLLPGIVGKFMFVIPLVVTVGLLISLLEAFWILPSHVISLRERSRRKPAPSGWQASLRAWRWRFSHGLRLRYTTALIYALRRARLTLTMVVLIFVLAVAALISPLIKMQFFAFDPIRLFYVNVDMPPDSSIAQTLAETERVAAVVRAQLEPGDARSVTSVAGLKFTDIEPLYGDSYGQITVSLAPRRDEMRTTDRVVEDMRETIESLPSAGKLSFLIVAGGPPAGKPIAVKVRSEDYAELRAATDALKAKVAQIPGVKDLGDDDVPGRAELVLELDREAVRRAGLDPATLNRLLRLHVDGEFVAELREGGERLRVRVRREPSVLTDPVDLLDDPIALPGGGTTTLAALVSAQTGRGSGIIRHHQLRRSITVEAELDLALNDTVSANQAVRDAWDEIRTGFPGTDLDFSGELDDINESLGAMPGLFLIGLGLIYLILAAQFRSYFQPLMVLVTVPLAFTGVTLGLLISRLPVSLYTLYGVIALTGIAVNASIVLMDAANTRLRSGMGLVHATVYAARRRVVPVVMTTSTTIAGLFSLAVGLGGQSLLWGPVASSIVWGLGFSTLLTLFVVPLLYLLFMRKSAGLRAEG
jgi:multidrug efflux pump subunit AcrB